MSSIIGSGKPRQQFKMLAGFFIEKYAVLENHGTIKNHKKT